jgi:hypothetical protein
VRSSEATARFSGVSIRSAGSSARTLTCDGSSPRATAGFDASSSILTRRASSHGTTRCTAAAPRSGARATSSIARSSVEERSSHATSSRLAPPASRAWVSAVSEGPSSASASDSASRSSTITRWASRPWSSGLSTCTASRSAWAPRRSPTHDSPMRPAKDTSAASSPHRVTVTPSGTSIAHPSSARSRSDARSSTVSAARPSRSASGHHRSAERPADSSPSSVDVSAVTPGLPEVASEATMDISPTPDRHRTRNSPRSLIASLP